MRDRKVDLAVCDAATKGMPFDIVGLADMARWYMTRCTGLEAQLKCAEDANDQLKAGAEAEIKKLAERCNKPESGQDATTVKYPCGCWASRRVPEFRKEVAGKVEEITALQAENRRLREALEMISLQAYAGIELSTSREIALRKIDQIIHETLDALQGQ